MFDKIIRENQFKTKCVIVIYLIIFVLIGLLVDIIRINAQSLSGGFYSLLTLQQFPLVTLLMLGIAGAVVLFTISRFKQILLSGSEYKEILKGKESNAQERLQQRTFHRHRKSRFFHFCSLCSCADRHCKPFFRLPFLKVLCILSH